MCIVRRLKDGTRECHVANCGDTRAVLNNDNKEERITKDHKATDEEEQKRVKDAGGLILRQRVSG